MDDIRRATVIELAGADITIRAGLLNGSRGFTMVRKARRLISKPPPPGSSDVHRCARCDDSAVLLAFDGDDTWEYLCREHGYAGTWMTRDEFHARLAHYRATRLKPDAIVAFVMWGMKRIRG
jgi:hypothetical protein